MRDLHTSDMKFLPLVCLLTCPGMTSADDNGFISVSEGADAVLLCSLSSKESIEKTVFDWKKDQKEVFLYDRGQHYNNGRVGQDKQFEGRVSHFEDELKFGNASIRIHRTKLSDNGSYTCTFPNKQKSHIMLYVDPDPEHFVLKDRTYENIPGATPKPTITYLNQRKDRSLLHCEVQGVPKPTVVWKDSTGNILPAKEPEVVQREGRFYITLQIVVTKTDNFTCVATQEKIHHQINATTSVYIHVPESPTGWIVAVAVLGAILFLVSVAGVVVAVLCAQGHLSANFKTGAISNSETAQLKGNSPSGHLTDPSL